MKKHAFVFFFSVFLTHLSAQTKFTPEWNVGAGFGVNFPSMSFQPSFKIKSQMTYMGGVAVRYISEKNLGVIAELNYSEQGWEQDFTGMALFEHSRRLNYLEMPFLTHIYFGNKVRFFVNLGAKFAFLLSEKESVTQALLRYIQLQNTLGQPIGFEINQIGKNTERKFDYGLVGGLGLEFRSGIGHFALEGRYSFSLSDIYNNSRADAFARSANRVATIKLTYYTKLF